MSEAKDWNKLTIAMLKQELANRKLDVNGKKSDLISRLEKSEPGSKDLASGDGPAVSENNKHDDNTTGEEFSVDGLQLVDEFVDEDYLEEEEKMDGADGENEDDKAEQLKSYDLATLYIPKVNEMHKDLQVAQKFRVLYIYPLRTEMMGDPAVQIHFLRCSSVLCKFYPTETPDGYVSEGYVILRFEFSEDALTAMEELTNILPSNVNIKVRQLGQTHMHVLSGIIRTEPKGVEIWLKDNKNTKVVFVGNLPATATEAALKEIFTGATIIRIAREDDSSSKGYAIVGYDNVKDAEQAAEEHSSAVLDNYELAVYYYPSLTRPTATEKEQGDKLKKSEQEQKHIGLKSEEAVRKESWAYHMKKGRTNFRKSGVTPLKPATKAGQQPIKKESATPQGKAGTASKKPVVTAKEEGVKKEAVSASVKKETTERNGQASKKTDTKPAAGSGSKTPAAGTAKTPDKKPAGDNARQRRGPRPTKSVQRYPQGRGGSVQGGRGGSVQGGRGGSVQGGRGGSVQGGRGGSVQGGRGGTLQGRGARGGSLQGRGGSATGRGRGINGRPGFTPQRRVGKWEMGTARAGMRGSQMQPQQQQPRSSFGVRTQKRQGLWEQALERRQEQRTTGGSMQRQSSFGSQQFGSKRQFPYGSDSLDDKRRRMEETVYGRQSSYEPRAPSLLDMSITKRMTQQMSPNAGFQQGGSGMGQGVGGMSMGGGIGMGQGGGYEHGGGFEQTAAMGMRGDIGQDMGIRGGLDRGMAIGGGMDHGGLVHGGGMDHGSGLGYGGEIAQDRGMMAQDRGIMQDRGMMGQDRGMMGQDRGMMGQDRGMLEQDRGIMGHDRDMLGQDRGMMGQDRGMMGHDRDMLGQDRGMMGHERGLVHERLGVKVEQDMGMVQGGTMYDAIQQGYGGGNQGRMQSSLMGAGEMDQGHGGVDQGPGGMGQGSSGTVNLLLGLTQMLSNQLPQRQMRPRRPRGNQSFVRGAARGGSRGGARVVGPRSTRGFNGSRR